MLIFVEVLSAYGSPSDERSSHRFDFAASHWPVTTAVKAIGDSIREDEIFVAFEKAVLHPARQQVAETIPPRRHGRHGASVDAKIAAGRVDSITGSGDNGFEDVPVPPILTGPRPDIPPHGGGDAELHQLPIRGRGSAADVQARLHAGRGVDHNLAIGVTDRDNAQHRNSDKAGPPESSCWSKRSR